MKTSQVNPNSSRSKCLLNMFIYLVENKGMIYEDFNEYYPITKSAFSKDLFSLKKCYQI